MLAHRVAGAFAIVEKARIGDLAFQLLEAVPFARDEGLEVHKQKRRLRDGAQSPFFRWNQLSFFGDAGPDGLCAAITAGKLLDPTGGVDELLFAGEKRMAGGANANFDVPAGRAGMVDRTAGADHFRLVIVRMNVRFHVGKRVRTVAAESAGRKW